MYAIVICTQGDPIISVYTHYFEKSYNSFENIFLQYFIIKILQYTYTLHKSNFERL